MSFFITANHRNCHKHTNTNPITHTQNGRCHIKQSIYTIRKSSNTTAIRWQRIRQERDHHHFAELSVLDISAPMFPNSTCTIQIIIVIYYGEVYNIKLRSY